MIVHTGTPASSALLHIAHLTKVYRKGVRANDDISLQVRAGEVYGLLGHNGAGKTTLLNQVIGLAMPTSGTIHIDGRDAVADPDMARRACSIQPQAQAPLAGVTPRQGIEIMARIRGASRRDARKRTDELLDALDITEWADKSGENLSGGVQRLTAFAMAAANPGELVMFDEPTNDVDPVRRRLLWAQVRALADEGRAVLLVTHNVIEAEHSVQRLAILDSGRVVAEGTPAELRGEHSDWLRLDVTARDAATAAELAADLTGVEPPVLTGLRVRYSIDPDTIGAAIDWAQRGRAAGRVDEFSVNPASLEDVYIRLVGTENGKEADNAVLVS